MIELRKSHYIRLLSTWNHRLITGLFLVLLAGSSLIPTNTVEAAYTDDPMGYLDSCSVTADGYTVLYGWVHDANALSGNFPQAYIEVSNYGYFTVDTYITGYRDAQINAWINSQVPGTPAGNTYGFIAYLAGLAKGGTYAVSGLAVNYGAGTNRPLGINNLGYVDGDSTKPYFPGSVIPQSCIYTPPPPTPVPTATPTPPPTPNPTTPPPSATATPKPTSSATPKPTSNTPVVTVKPNQTSGTAPSNATIITPQQASDTPTAAPITEGANLWTAINPNATSLDVTVFAKDAKMAELYFGSEENNLAKQGEQDLSTNRADFTISNLTPLTPYYYKVVSRNNDGTSTEGKPRLINTKGYKLSLTFRSDGQDAKGISARIKEKSVTQNSSTATVVFQDLTEGLFTVEYTYKTISYTTQVRVDPDNAAVDDIISTVITIPPAATANAKKSPRWYVFIGIATILLVGGLLTAYFARIRKKSKRTTYYSDSDPQAYETLDSNEFTPAAQQSEAQYQHIDPPPGESVPGAPHRGQSLKEMVLQSMGQTAVQNHSESQHQDSHQHHRS